jgi:hypothetical protein
MHAATSHIGSAPRLAEDVVAFVPVFPPGTRAKKRFWRPISPKLSGRPFSGGTLFAFSRFISASDVSEAAPVEGGSPGTTSEASLHLLVLMPRPGPFAYFRGLLTGGGKG